jgi:hypothetical protein
VNQAIVLVSRSGWAKQICERWSEQVPGILATGRLLCEAKASLPHGDFEAMVEADLPFNARAAQKLMAIASNPVLSKASHGTHLPPAWTTLYELSRVPEKRLAAAIESGKVTPATQRSEAKAFLPASTKATPAPPRRSPKSLPLYQALEEARAWTARWGHIAALAPLCNSIITFLEGQREKGNYDSDPNNEE